jgi:alkanesulfonate monooxygenase SsuD/methylene tetrahydromethanopterin reductase-like flavin-dependent oxidoreductase (luciferase family)
MRLGIWLPMWKPDGTALRAQDIARRAKAIEDAGFDTITIGESIGRSQTTPRPDIQMWLTAAAASTQRVELITAILESPFRYPVEFAQRLMTSYGLSGGRFVAGLGAGSTRADYDAVGLDFEQRFKLFNEGLPIIKRLLDGETVGAANIHPWPNVVGRPPIMIGSWHSGFWVKKAAREYDGWQGSALTSYNALKEGIERFRDAGGKRAMVCTIAINLKAPREPLGDDERVRLFCGPEEAAERLNRFAELGYDDVCVTPSNHAEDSITLDELPLIRSLVPRHRGTDPSPSAQDAQRAAQDYKRAAQDDKRAAQGDKGAAQGDKGAAQDDKRAAQ